MYNVNVTDEDKALFDEFWNENTWRTMPILDGALKACQSLHQAGYGLVCVTAMPARLIEDRLENLRSRRFPIDKVISSAANTYFNPKEEIIEDLQPVSFVDDLRGNFKDMPIQN